MEKQNNINWFPGHMKKAVDELKSIAKKVDFVIEVLDSRGINITSNTDLKQIFINKPILKIALKNDLSDLTESIYEDISIINTKEKKSKEIILNKLDQLFHEKINNLRKKGLIQPEFVGVVVGLPNLGKSSLINLLTSNNNLKVENRSGVTKNQSLRRINKNFYLIDTPGVFFKKINNNLDGYKLSILNCLSKQVMPMYDVLNFFYDYLNKEYPNQINNYFKIKEVLSFNEFIEFICKKYKFYKLNNELDLDRFNDFMFNLFSLSKICKFHFN